MPSGLLSKLESETFEGAVLVLVERKDGLRLGFTDSDRALVLSGDVYEPSDGLRVSRIGQTAGTGVDNMDVFGAVSSARITAADLTAGLWDSAQVTVRLVDRTDTGLGAVVLLRGRLGEVSAGSGEFRAEVRSLSHLLKQQVGDLTSPTCRCRRLGDPQCKFDLDSATLVGPLGRSTRVLASGSGRTLTFSSDPAPSGFYKFGVVRFVTGSNAGIEREVKAHSLSSGNAVVELRQAFPFEATPGESAVLEAGCDRLSATCRDKFGNAANFHGEPRLPGNDKTIKRGRPPA
ncbi:MAG: DUF2163 domain-containing protein [Fimbriimonadaceae bacterium]|nr:DUF2163 domain-containing protein [Fimbriimonadaceae bacterium]